MSKDVSDNDLFDYLKEGEENTCFYCEKPCKGTYCSKECKIADLND